MKKLKILILLFSIVSFSLLLADDDYEKEKRDKHHIFRSLKHLDLSKKQYKKIRKILIKYKKDYKDFYEYKVKKEKELADIMKSDEFDKEEYIKKHIQIKTYALEIEADKFKEIHHVLTPRQRVKFSYFLEEWEVE